MPCSFFNLAECGTLNSYLPGSLMSSILDPPADAKSRQTQRTNGPKVTEV